MNIKSFYLKHKEVILYLFFGGLSFVLNIGLFALLNVCLNLNELIANVIAWIIVVAFVFFTNRSYVFDSKVSGIGAFFKQLFYFFAGRVLTLILEEGIIFLFITKLQMPSILVKTAAQIVVIVSNYFISKLVVFRNKTDS